MLKGVFLVFEPISCWENVYHSRPGSLRILLLEVIPLLLLAMVAESYHLMKWGKWQDVIGHQRFFTLHEVAVVGVAQTLLWIIFILLAARMVQALTQTFHARGSYQQALAVVSYSLAPLFIIELFNALPFVSFWITWAVGMLLTVRALYHGLPRIMDPDPIHTFGLFLTSTMIMVVSGAMLRFVSWWYFRGHIRNLDDVIASLGARLPF